MSKTSSTLFRPLTSLPFKLILIISAVALLSFSFLFSSSFDLDVIVSSFRSSLRPPYLYLIINAIIITIAASSRLNRHSHCQPPPPDLDDFAAKTTSPIYDHHQVSEVDFATTNAADPLMYVDDLDHDRLLYNSDAPAPSVDFETPPLYDPDLDRVVDQDLVYYGGVSDDEQVIEDVEVVDKTPRPIVEEEEVNAVVEKLNRWNPAASVAEKPSVNSRFAHHRRPVRASPEGGKALGVAKPRKQETLETTWKTITEGRHMPLTRHLKKSDTWETHNRQINSSEEAPKKSKTFRGRTGGNSNRLRKEPSVGQDELNRRVELFIKKFNEDMRLERQRSMQQFMDMINRAA
ncbi:hypothetical protein AKJ16_DCAP14464 [Drosera capensis]